MSHDILSLGLKLRGGNSSKETRTEEPYNMTG